MLIVPPLMIMSPFESTPSVSPAPIAMVTFPSLSSKRGSYADDLLAALMPSSVALIFILPPFICIAVPSIASAAVRSKVPSSIFTIVVACRASSDAFILILPPLI